MANAKSTCFNKLIRDELDTVKTAKRGFAELILEWVFSEKQRLDKRKYCCDACHRQTNFGSLSYFAENVISSMPSKSLD